MAKPHVITVPLVGEGHLTPMMHLGLFLAKCSYPVTLAVMYFGDTPFDPYTLIKKKGAWPPPGLPVTIEKLTTEVSFPNTTKPREISDFLLYTETYQESLEQLVRRINSETSMTDHGSCVILSDYLVGHWCMNVANKLGIPGGLLFTGSITWSWFELHMAELCSSDLVPNIIPDESQDLPDEENTLISDCPYRLRRSEIPEHFWSNKPFQEYTIEKLSRVVFEHARWILMNSSRELEGEALALMVEELGAKLLPVGPLFLLHGESDHAVAAGMRAYNRECLQWLDEQSPSSVVYIAFGSIATLSEEQIGEFASGLEASKRNFLWVIRSEEISKLLPGFLERTKEQGLVVEWSPQAQVLSHSSVAAFVSHCGWNSTMEALGNGKPLLCWPLLFDQSLNSKLIVEKWKAGVTFEKNDKGVVVKSEMERVLNMIMDPSSEEGKQVRNSAMQLKKRLHQTTQVNGDSFTNLEAFLEVLQFK